MAISKTLSRLGALILALALTPAPAWPQGSPSGPVEPTLPPVGAPQPTAPPANGRPSLVPNAGDPVDVDEVTLPAKPAAVLAGTSTWDDGFQTLKTAFGRIEAELAKAGIAPAGRPITVFVQTDDNGFRYEAMVPIERAPEGRPNLTPDIRFGTTPSGRALRFVHKGPYDDVDSTYETVTAYLDAKNIEVQDSFVEEYVTDLTSSEDEDLTVNIFALPK
jgi:effector-binding domain-containing protein